MVTNRKQCARRISVWLLIFSLLILTATAAFPVHAMPMNHGVGEAARDVGNGAKDIARDAANGVGDAARDAANGAKDIVRDATNGVGNAVRDAADNVKNGEGGQVSDGDGVIGNESNAAADATTDTQSRVGQVALIVVIVAVVIAVIMIVLLIPKKKKD